VFGEPPDSSAEAPVALRGCFAKEQSRFGQKKMLLNPVGLRASVFALIMPKNVCARMSASPGNILTRYGLFKMCIVLKVGDSQMCRC